MDERIAEINRFTTGWMGYFQLADARGCSAIWTSGSAARCGRSAGRKGNVPGFVRPCREISASTS